MTTTSETRSEDPLVSIVIPTYNQEDYLAIAIDSVLAQDYQNVECIVIDDGSTDGTSKVLERYQDRVTCIRQANGGQSRALNRGWSMCHGDILGYLSSDDRLLPQAVSLLVKALVGESTVVVAYCDFELIDNSGRVIRLRETEDYQESRMTVDLECLVGPGALFRKEVFTRAGGWREDLRQCPDFEYWLRAMTLGGFTRVKECLAQFRIHEESASFRPVSYDRCDELIGVAREFWESRRGSGKQRAMSISYIMSARHHAQSGRFFTALSRMGAACRHSPRTVCAPTPWRLFVYGILRATYYRILWRKGIR